MIHFKRLSPAFFLFSIILFLSYPSIPLAQTCTDVDGDGYGLNGDASCPNPGVDCNDGNSTMYPFAPILCDGLDNNCDGIQDFGTDRDVDGDGVPRCGGDCDDNDPLRFPGNAEVFGGPTCSDFIDNDCDHRVDGVDPDCQDICNDNDNDGYGRPGHPSCTVPNITDCNDNNASINPGITDTNCNGVDDNCSGTADDGYVVTPTNCGVGECASSGQIECQGATEVDTCNPGTPVDESPIGSPECSDGLDNDCDGTTDALDLGCAPCTDNDGDGYGSNGDVTCANGTAIDCNDNDAAINPGATDANCDLVDDNCSGTADNEYVAPPTVCGEGACVNGGFLECQVGVTVDSCVPLAAGTEGPFPGPTCSDGIDNDCDGLTDVADIDCSSLDSDDDGDGFSENQGDCDDTNPTIFLNAPLLCDALDNNCDGLQDFGTDKDVDGDGVPRCAGDCDDTDPLRYPGNPEFFGLPSCSDGIDNDCDNRIDIADPQCADTCTDNDGDGYGKPGHPSCTNGNATDCNDNNINVHPGATDTDCNGVDDNCSGTADDGYVPAPTNCGTGECAAGGQLECQSGSVVDTCTPGTPVDESPIGSLECSDGLDNDCDGDTDAADLGCAPCTDNDGDGYGSNGDVTCANGTAIDCNDNDAAINPGATDANCDTVDDNCSGTADDGYVPAPTNCGVGACTDSGQLECQSGSEVDTCIPLPAGTEGPYPGPTCVDAIDNDCDGLTDGLDSDCSSLDIDDDGDGQTENQGDCNDTNPTVFLNAPLLCDALDNNCDGFVDFKTDVDVDGDRVPRCAGDCDDSDPLRYPGNAEFFGDISCSDGIDNDCDNLTDILDPQCADTCTDDDGDGYGNPGHSSCTNGSATDCNDNNAAINPGATDTDCNGVDDNCSGTADDGYIVTPTNCGVGECVNSGQLECQSGSEVDTCNPGTPVDESPIGSLECSDGLDNDCDGDIDAADLGCAPCTDNDGDGYGSNGDVTCANGTAIDCNDDDAAINPGATDANCDTVDDNCSGTADDGYVPAPTNCGTGECGANGQWECQGGVEVDTCVPGAPVPENTPNVGVCIDGLDNDCDGLIDQLPGIDDPECSSADIDDDGDGFCEGPTCSDGSIPGDCDDTNDTVHPGAPLLCDGLDTNCDGSPDFGTDRDVDGDGVPRCGGDCDDTDPLRYPGNEEIYGDPSCSDGIDNDCSGAADDCPIPTCDTKVAPRNGPHIFDLMDPGTDPADPADDTLVTSSCSWCHTDILLGTGTVNQRPDCQRCHADPTDTSDLLNGVLKDPDNPNAYPGNPPYGFGTAPNVMQHSSTVLGTKYGGWDMDCLTCHNPHMQEQDARYGTGYGMYIKEYICFDNTATGGGSFEEIIAFTAASGPGSFADAPPKNANICEMCHTLTNHHRRDDVPEGPGGPSHSDSKNCTNCHRHSDGFAPNVIPAWHHDSQPFLDNCDYCHVTPTDFITPVPDSKCNQCHTPDGVLKLQFPQEFSGAIDVLAHTDANGSGKYVYTNACIDCHEPMFDEATNLKLIRFKILKSVLPGSNIEFSAYSGPGSFADGPPHEDNICETCHTLTNHHQADGTAPGGQSHNFEATCTNCHSHSLGFLPGAEGQSHDTHLKGEKGPRIDCATGCHGTNIPPFFADGNDLASTTVCDNCHSPGGVIDGVNDPAIGAKPNWENGIYDDRVLQVGKEMWCSTCHDDAPANSRMNGYGVSAANVVGDNSTFGFYVTGHGQNIQIDCIACHDVNSQHIDHESVHLLDNSEKDKVFNLTDYRFYLGKRLEIKHHNSVPDKFRLCFTCHEETWITDTVTLAPDLETNFRKDNYTLIHGMFNNGNLHAYHTAITSCSTCHNVHGLTLDASESLVPTFTRMMREWAGSYVNLTYDTFTDKYYELTDPAKWNDPVYNQGGASTSPLYCGSCHGYTDLTNGVGPDETYVMFGAPWYLRTYKPHSYPVVFDMDSDGLTDNIDNCPAVANIDQADADIDYVGDACDTCPNDPINDADVDGLCGDVDICPYDRLDDYDGDGICGDIDNCDAHSNLLQADSDEDGIGDICDNCVNIPNPDQANFDGDMLGDVCDDTCSSYVQLSIDYFTLPEIQSPASAVFDSAGNVYIAAITEVDLAGQIGGQDMVIIKYDVSGNPVWTAQFGTAVWDYTVEVVIDSNDNLFVLGRDPDNLLVVKYDSAGNHQWMFQTPGFPRDIAVDNSGNVYAVSQYGLVKLDTDGNELWTAPQSGSFIQYPMSIYVDNAANVYVAGMNQYGFYDLIIKKFDTYGTLQWTTTLDPDDWTYIDDIVADNLGNSYITGTARGNFANISTDDEEHFTFKLDPAGNLLWARQVPLSVMGGSDKITIDNTGNIFVTDHGLNLISYDPDGNQRFVSHFTVADHFATLGIIYDSAGLAYFTGVRNTAAGSPQELYIMYVGGQCQQP